jgi:sRNA-binding regulator protein Hfq
VKLYSVSYLQSKFFRRSVAQARNPLSVYLTNAVRLTSKSDVTVTSKFEVSAKCQRASHSAYRCLAAVSIRSRAGRRL